MKTDNSSVRRKINTEEEGKDDKEAQDGNKEEVTGENRKKPEDKEKDNKDKGEKKRKMADLEEEEDEEEDQDHKKNRVN